MGRLSTRDRVALLYAPDVETWPEGTRNYYRELWQRHGPGLLHEAAVNGTPRPRAQHAFGLPLDNQEDDSMGRVPHWEVKLHDAMLDMQDLPFSYEGGHDCATFAFNIRRIITGKDATADWKGRYKTEQGAARMLRKLGCETVEDLARKYLGEPLESHLLAQRGDILLKDGGLGVCMGRYVYFIGGEGMVKNHLRECEKAWRVQ